MPDSINRLFDAEKDRREPASIEGKWLQCQPLYNTVGWWNGECKNRICVWGFCRLLMGEDWVRRSFSRIFPITGRRLIGW